MFKWFRAKNYGTILTVQIFLLFIAAVMQGHIILEASASSGAMFTKTERAEFSKRKNNYIGRVRDKTRAARAARGGHGLLSNLSK